VAEVRSLTQPLGTVQSDPARIEGGGLVGQLLGKKALERARRAAREYYVSEVGSASVTQPGGATDNLRHVTRLEVVLHSDPFAPASYATLKQLRFWLEHEMPRTALVPGPVRAETYGVTVNARDLAEVTAGDRVRINTLILAAIFLILWVLVRRVWLAACLLGTVLLSYYAALGATVFAGILGSGTLLWQLDWRVPFFLFTILVAVGADYNILLVTRTLQERARHGAREGIRRALAQTGGAISSCGLIMAGTFATLMLAGLGTLVQIGFALAFGVLLDTFVVRPFLVPAFVLLVWQRQKKAKLSPPLPVPAQQKRAG
jgi:RND superfamily putative drug exporter